MFVCTLKIDIVGGFFQISPMTNLYSSNIIYKNLKFKNVSHKPTIGNTPVCGKVPSEPGRLQSGSSCEWGCYHVFSALSKAAKLRAYAPSSSGNRLEIISQPGYSVFLPFLLCPLSPSLPSHSFYKGSLKVALGNSDFDLFDHTAEKLICSSGN